MLQLITSFIYTNFIPLAHPLPYPLLHSLEHVKGFDKEAFLQVHASGEQVTSIRYNPQKAVQENSMAEEESVVPWCPYGRYLSGRPSFTFDPLFHAGAYYVQEASSMFVWHILEQCVGTNTSGLKVLDLCAAPGGKTTLLASYFADGFIVANDVIKSRASVLTENLTKWGVANAVVTNNDPKDFAPLAGYFDVILVDAPCSGSGLFRRDNDAIGEWSEAAVTLCSQRQQRILADILPALKAGGLLIYSTCSYSAEEDEQILDWLMGHEALDPVNCNPPAEWNIVEVQPEQHNARGYRFYPDKIRGEGFFIAAFRKPAGVDFVERKLNTNKASKGETAIAGEWVKPGGTISFIKQKDSIIAIPDNWLNEVALLQKYLYLRKAGVRMGGWKGKSLVPDHELALSLLMNDTLPRVLLDKDQALQYLRKKEIQLPLTVKGWALANYKGVDLGWMKVLQNRINNYYPTEWRILKD